MADELLSLRIIVVSPSPGDRAMFRNAATAARVPIELVESDGEAGAGRSIAAGADLAFLDMALGGEVVARMALAARAASNPPFTVALCGPGDTRSFPIVIDGQASRPQDEGDAQRLIAGLIRLRLPSRVLLVDDWPPMRSIVRRVLAATRFPLQVTEAGDGGEALALARTVDFDLIFFDHNLPGVSGLEAIAELRRAKRYPDFVLMTSADDEALAEKAHAQGIAFLKKPFYPADLEWVLCGFCGLRALGPVRR
jgi:CheY-like chemotaxis protein